MLLSALCEQQQLYEVEAAMVDAERDYQVITGLSLRPAATFSEEIRA